MGQLSSIGHSLWVVPEVVAAYYLVQEPERQPSPAEDKRGPSHHPNVPATTLNCEFRRIEHTATLCPHCQALVYVGRQSLIHRVASGQVEDPDAGLLVES